MSISFHFFVCIFMMHARMNVRNASLQDEKKEEGAAKVTLKIKVKKCEIGGGIRWDWILWMGFGFLKRILWFFFQVLLQNFRAK